MAVPFESDGMKLLRLPFAKVQDLRREFARFYVATALETLNDGDTAGALSSCREGLAKFGPPWSNVLHGIEAIILSRTGDHSAAQAKAERDLAGELPPVARAMALNNWSWFAFLRRDEADLRRADRRSADALILQPKLAFIAGTRGTILLWQGRVAEAIALLERSYDRANNQHGRDVNAACWRWRTRLGERRPARRPISSESGILARRRRCGKRPSATSARRASLP